MKYIYTLAFALITFFVNAQDPYLQQSNAEADALTRVISSKYQGALGMPADQVVRFNNKIEEFVLRRQKINALDMTTRDKLQLLQQLSHQETAEMANILTRPQLQRYRELKKEIQPVQVVVGEVE
ncbi:hypothetical protein FK220_011680 [Flavobacteriaceae bacterium TP-CH-4]|uniref:LTXXQ motif family protein n=1 Tax=Pelagihabitans pacificus TaxID=2696054 RepID=A0A967ATB5_9FLAO|nr:hypothetical protein [Pelagihabitans pacificus]NHF60006.1 hypothetical protein [Pelagihabitans pacificus]